ncbi:CGGC domain-containing protein [Clostridium butyricum]|nr:CGGC domain-containing protein [Clostridium butyricum]
MIFCHTLNTPQSFLLRGYHIIYPTTIILPPRVGFNTCGGCPGKKAVTRAAEMVKRGADTIVLCSCITKGNPIGFACPHAKEMKEAIIKKLGDSVTIIDYTH